MTRRDLLMEFKNLNSKERTKKEEAQYFDALLLLPQAEKINIVPLGDKNQMLR